MCYAEKAEQAQQHPGTKTATNPAEDNSKKQRKLNEIKPDGIPINPRKLHNPLTHSQIPSRVNYLSTPMMHLYRDAPACTRSSGGRPHGTGTHKPAQPAEGLDAM